MSQEVNASSSDAMVRKLSSFFESALKAQSESFCIQNEALAPEEIAAHDGLLALFMFKAAEGCEEAMKTRLPLFFESDTSALIDVVPRTEASEFNLFSLWTHHLHYALEEEVRRLKREKKLVNGMIPLDDLYRRWHQAVVQQRYSIKPASPKPQGAAA